MSEEHRILFDNPWVDLRLMRYPERGVNGYVYSHERRCNGQIVAVLPYLRRGGTLVYLLREEVTPCWGMAPALSALTGGVEDGQGPRDCALTELREESGYVATLADLILLGTCRGTKSTDTTYHLFAVDVTTMEKGPADGDGSELEAQARMVELTSIDGAVDPLVYVLAYRLSRAYWEAGD